MPSAPDVKMMVKVELLERLMATIFAMQAMHHSDPHKAVIDLYESERKHFEEKFPAHSDDPGSIIVLEVLDSFWDKVRHRLS
ncbi:MAG: hypothetical protein K2X43_05160 [Hyphomonadaceae bacterium]|jgi:hypothetical protein|nr:hypothetical protein [Hyphomonadaceae bacterium]